MANTTVYPFGTEGTLPAGYPIINDLRTGGADKALAAEQGKFLGELLIEPSVIDLNDFPRVSRAIDTNGVWNNTSGLACVLFRLSSAAKSFKCTADGGNCQFAFLKTNTTTVGTTPDYATGTTKIVLYDGNTEEYNIPADANYLYVYTHTTSTEISGRYKDFTLYSSHLEILAKDVNGEAFRTIHPLVTYDIVRGSNGEFGTNPDFANMKELASVRFIKTSKGFKVKAGADCLFRVFYYDADFSFIAQGTNSTSLTANTETDIALEYDCTYIKFYLYNNDGMPSTTIELTGYFPEDWDTFNPRPSDSGYHRVSVLVNVTNPTCCDEETQTVQDTRQLLPDYGVICLPTQYSPTGKPTRLIIYCHGAAVNYADNASRFNSVDLDPTYWLAEGYAILDVEGNPFDNTNEHICIPQTMDCYVAAYKWAIEHYNLCRDGIFLGGRSMGGQNTFNLMRRECPIPVIAACPNSAAPDLSFGYGEAARKAFCALHMGFIVPIGFSWSNGALTSSEKQVLSDNWDKYIKCCPELSACLNLPDKVTLLANNTGADKVALWETLHMMAKCPVKLFGCNQDESCPPPSTTSLYYRMLINSGQITECRLFNSYKDYTGTGTSAHHYDTQDPALRADITTTYGEALTAVPIVYIEMLEFWRRYEQGL